MTLLGSNGNQIYHEYFKSPGQSGFVKVLAGVVAVASTAYGNGTAARAGAIEQCLWKLKRFK